MRSGAKRATPGSPGTTLTPGRRQEDALEPTVREMAESLGLQLPREQQLLWVAELAAREELPGAWTALEHRPGEPAFYNSATKRVSKQHPVVTRCKQYLHRLTAFREVTGTPERNVKAHMAVVLNEVLNRCHRELPPVTPEIIERVAVLLDINTAVDHRLTTKVKAAIELYAEEQYDVAIQASQKADVDGLLRLLRKEQWVVEVLGRLDGVIMCSELEHLAAQVKCEQCFDYFSLDGFVRTHPRGSKREHHTTVKCEQFACSVYPHEFATCKVDGVLFCDQAYEEAAAKDPFLRRRQRTFLAGFTCSEHPGHSAEVLCEDCCDFLCWQCFLELHGHGHRREHVALKLEGNSLLYRGGEPCPPEETARLISRARFCRDGGPWLAFRDDQLDGYWYHLSDKVVTKQNPYLGPVTA